jgi:phosphoglycerate dehydrogenase-like enzyme
MAQAKDEGRFRAEGLYNSLDEIDGYIAEAAGIIRKPKVSAEDMKKVEQLKNLARAKIGCGNLRRDLLMGWDKIAKVLGTLGDKTRKSA